MLRSEVTGHRPRVSPQWRVILARVREQHWRVREQHWKESEEGEFAQRERAHACARRDAALARPGGEVADSSPSPAAHSYRR